MNGLVVLAAAACVASGQILAPGLAPAPGAASQFHAQDEFGQFSFGHAGGPLARSEARNAYGITTGSYQYVDANGILQTAQYVSDPINGFRVSATNLPVGPVAPAAPEVAPLVAPVFDLPLPVAPQETAEVAAARAAHAEALAAADAAAEAAPAEERKRREAEEEKAAEPATPIIVNPYTAGLFAGHPGVYAAAPAQIVANIETAAPVSAAIPAVLPGAYALPAGLPAALPATYAGLPAALPATYAGVAAPLAAPVAAAAPSREAVLTTIKANPGHAIVYRVD